MIFPLRSRNARLAIACLLGLFAAFPLGAATIDYELRIDPVDRDRVYLPVTATIVLPAEARGTAWAAELQDGNGSPRVAQIEICSSTETDDGMVRVHWVEPIVASGQSPVFSLTLLPEGNSVEAKGGFRFKFSNGFQDLFFGDRGVYRHMTGYDPERHRETHKPYHHIYGFNGEGFITKGPGGQFQHHKGIYLGWNQTRLADGRRYDFWHAPKEFQRHREYLKDRQLTGPVLARSASNTDWITPEGEPVIRDTREVTTWKLAGDVLMFDYLITIQALAGDVYLGGDAHHSGFQFRASTYVAENADKTVIISPPDAKRRENDIWADAPWMAASFDVEGHPYTVVHLDRTGKNPAPTTYSSRNYGRFGAFFTSPVQDGEPLILNYRIFVKGARGEDAASPAALEALHADYLEPAAVQAERK